MIMKTIVWDVDDVLNDFMLLWFERYWKSGHTDCLVEYISLKDNPPHKLLGITLKEYQDSIDSFRRTDVYKEMHPLPEVMRWFKGEGHKYRHIALSAVPLNAAHYSSCWVLEQYGMWIRSFSFVPSKRNGENIPKYDETKNDYLKWLGKGDIIIDDNEINIKSANEIGVKGILFPRPWNKCEETIQNVLESIKKND